MRALFKMEPIWANPAEFATLVVLADFANREGLAWPSKPTIARLIGVGPKQVGRITKALEQKRLIAIDPGAAPRGGNLYTLLFDAATVDISVPSERALTVDTNVHRDELPTLDISVHRADRDSGHLDTPTVDMTRPTVDIHVPAQWTPVSPNPSTDPVLRDPGTEPVPSAQSSSRAQEDEDRKHADMLRTKSAAMRLAGQFSTKEELAAAVRDELADHDLDASAFGVGIQLAWVGRQFGIDTERTA
jgi:hypothetical protein